MSRLAVVLGIALAALLLIVSAALFWILDTSSGARFVFTRLSNLAGYGVSIKSVEGRLLDHLELRGVELSQAQLKARIDRIDLSWSPRQLFYRDVVVQRLTLSGVHIQDNRPPSKGPPSLTWPRVSNLARSFSAEISQLKLEDVSYRHLEEPPVTVSRFSSPASYQNGEVSLSDLHLATTKGQASGAIVAGFWRPSLRVDLALVPKQPIRDMDRFSLQARLLPGHAPEQLVGTIAAAGSGGGEHILELSADLGMTRNSFNVRALKLSEPGRRGMVTGHGSMTLMRNQTLYNLTLQASRLNLEKELHRETRISGEVNFSGSLSDFRGSIALSNGGPDWQAVSLAADFRGGGSQLTLAPISGKLLDGQLKGALDVAWGEVLSVSGKLSARGLKPGEIAPDWQGRVNLDMAGNVEVPKQGEPRGRLRGNLLESRLQGRKLTGEVAGTFAGKRVNVERLLLEGRGFHLEGAGELERRLHFDARVSDLSGLMPKAKGELSADGWVRWRDGRFSGAATGEGTDLAAAGMSVKAFSLDASLEEGEGYPMRLDASLNRLRVGRLQIAAAQVAMQGTAAQHTVKAKLSGAGSAAHLALEGGYEGGTWSGKLTRLYGRDNIGPWSLASPAAITMDTRRLTVDRLLITGKPGERVKFAADLSLKPFSGTVDGAWSAVDLARANPWLDRVTLAGRSAGDLRMRVLPDQRLALSLQADVQGTVISDGHRVDLRRVALSIAGHRDGLRAAADIALEGGAGEAHLLFRSKEPAALTLPKQGELRLTWASLDLALLRPFLPAGFDVTGRSAGLITGRLNPGRQLDVKGDVALQQGHVYWRAQDQQVDASVDTAGAGFSWRGAITDAGKGRTSQLKLDAHAAATGTYTAKGERIAFGGMTLQLNADTGGTRAALNLALERGGTLKIAGSSDAPATLGMPKTGEFTVQWRGIELALLKPWLPQSPDLALQGSLAGLVTGRVLPGGRIDLKGNALLEGGELTWRAEGEKLDASLDDANLVFSWLGSRPGHGRGGTGRLTLSARAAATGSYTAKGEQIVHGRLTLQADADERGTDATVELKLDEGGVLKVGLASQSPAGAGIPETGNLEVSFGGIDSVLLQPWLPGSLNLKGTLSGQASGKLLPGRRLDLSGEAEFSQGSAAWQRGSSEFNARLRSASLSFTWRGQTLSGGLSLALAEYGKLQGTFQLPFPARLPVAVAPDRPLQVRIAGRVREHGFLSAFFPGLVRETHGELDLDLQATGTWRNPRLGGTAQLANAGAYLPSAGIRVSGVQLKALLEGEQVRVTDFRALSGKGHLEGNLVLRLKGWQVVEYSGTLTGDQFQTVRLPELRMVTSPLINFQGNAKEVTLRGELRIPEMLISGTPVHQVVTASDDVVRLGGTAHAEKEPFPLGMDGKIRVVLGDKVEIKASGIEAKLGGSMNLVIKGLDKISSTGEIHVVKGRYRAYGLDLDIVRGRIYYVDDPVDQPTLDILALRKVGEVRAGVTVAGSLKAPVVELYSEPPMPEVDILAYMVLGHPMGASSEEGGAMALAATSLLSLGESTSLHEQIKDRLGLSVFGLKTVDTSSAGLMGYKEVQVAPPGEAPEQSTAAESFLTVGKYLTPELYVSYGRSLITGDNLLVLRYDISRRWQLQTQSGSESGVDIFYKIVFD